MIICGWGGFGLSRNWICFGAEQEQEQEPFQYPCALGNAVFTLQGERGTGQGTAPVSEGRCGRCAPLREPRLP